MMLKVILYAYMNNIYSCRRIESLLKRDIHFIYLDAGLVGIWSAFPFGLTVAGVLYWLCFRRTLHKEACLI